MWKVSFLAVVICCASTTAWACKDRGVVGTLFNSYTGCAASAPARGGPASQPWVMGNWCYTLSGNYPGPWKPVGSQCQASTPFGMQAGFVNRGWAIGP